MNARIEVYPTADFDSWAEAIKAERVVVKEIDTFGLTDDQLFATITNAAEAIETVTGVKVKVGVVSYSYLRQK